MAAATLVGLGLNFAKIDPIRALFWAAIINGFVAIPVMIVTMRSSTNKNVMGNSQFRGYSKLSGGPQH